MSAAIRNNISFKAIAGGAMTVASTIFIKAVNISISNICYVIINDVGNLLKKHPVVSGGFILAGCVVFYRYLNSKENLKSYMVKILKEEQQKMDKEYEGNQQMKIPVFTICSKDVSKLAPEELESLAQIRYSPKSKIFQASIGSATKTVVSKKNTSLDVIASFLIDKAVIPLDVDKRDLKIYHMEIKEKEEE